MERISRCPFCVTLLPNRTLVGRLLAFGGGKATCPRCGRKFSRKQGEHVAHLYDNILQDFENRLGKELNHLKICDRAEVLVQFGLKMENAKVASVDMLLRAITEQLDAQLAGMARGCDGRLNITSMERGKCQVVDIDALIEDGRHTRQRMRIARIDQNGFIQANMAAQEAVSAKFVAR